MKVATLTVLPLLAAGIAIRPSVQITPDTQQVEVPTIYHSDIPHGLEKRQFWDWLGQTLQQTLPSLLRWAADNITWMMKWQESPLKRAQMRPMISNEANKIMLKYGPWSLIGSNETNHKTVIQMDPKSTILVRTLRGMPSDAAILSSRPTLVFEDGSPATFNQGIYIHHFLIADMSKPSAPFALCPNMHKEKTWGLWTAGYVLEAVGAGLVQVGNDAARDPNLYYSKGGTVKSAFLTNKDDIFLMEAEIVNYNPSNRTVYLALELEYLDREPKQSLRVDTGLESDLIQSGSEVLDASTVVLSAEGCMPPGYMPPQKEKKYTHVSEKFEMNQDGWILNARGHLHDGGIAIDLERNGTVVCRSLPKYGKLPGAAPDVPDTILEMSWCLEPVRVKKGDYLVVKSHYDLDTHGLRQGSSAGGSGGMMHGGHGANGPPKEGGKGHAMDGGMEGMEEMGIFTTNFAWDGLGNKTATNSTNGFSFGSKGPNGINADKADADAKKSAAEAAAAAAASSASRPNGQGVKEESPLASIMPQGPQRPQGIEMQQPPQLPFGSISPQTLAAQQAAAEKAERDAANLAGLVAGWLTASGLNSLLGGLGGGGTSAGTGVSISVSPTSTTKSFATAFAAGAVRQ